MNGNTKKYFLEFLRERSGRKRLRWEANVISYAEANSFYKGKNPPKIQTAESIKAFVQAKNHFNESIDRALKNKPETLPDLVRAAFSSAVEAYNDECKSHISSSAAGNTTGDATTAADIAYNGALPRRP